MRPSRAASAAATFGRLEALRDVLRAVGVPRRDREQDRLLRPRLVALRHQARDERVIVLDHARLAPDLHAAAMRIVDQKQMRLGIFREIAERDVLPVAGEIGERHRALVEHVQEARRPAAVL